MTLTELNSAWQSLRNAALGRSGFEQHVSSELASRFTQAYAGWRQWYEQAGVTPEAFGSTHPEVLGWIKRYRDLAFDMRREGLQLPELGETAGEQLADVAGGIGKALAAIAAIAVLALLLKKRNRA